MSRWSDVLVTSLVGFVLVFGPFAFGSVHPQAYGLLEVAIFLALLVWWAKAQFWSASRASEAVLPRPIWIPLVALLAFVAFQMVPLPPGLLRVLSPSTHEAYSLALPGWPQTAPYARVLEELLERDDAGVQAEDLRRAIVLPTAEEVADGGAPIVPDSWGRVLGEPFLTRVERDQIESWVGRDHAGFASSWRPLSLDVARTWAEWLKVFAYCALFVLVTLYRPEEGRRGEIRFRRRLLRTVAFAAVAVAMVGLAQRMAWNGKILWFFVPWDWGEPKVLAPQTSGPFVSRNNFGGYLAMTLPLVLSPVLAPTWISLRSAWATRLAFGGGAALVATALLFSLSRGSWAAAAVGLVALVVGLVRVIPAEDRSRFLRDRTGAAMALGVVGMAIVVLLLLPTGNATLGSDVDRRLAQTLSSTASWGVRVRAWADSLPMLADFPLWGVGLGGWGGLFPKYDESFFLGAQLRRAHNDYLQLLAELGIVGWVLLGAVVWAVATRLGRSLRRQSGRSFATSMAVVAGLIGLAIHEWVDFDLQMPGIAATAVVLLALPLRSSWAEEKVAKATGRRFGLAACAAALLVAVVVQADPGRWTKAPLGMVASLHSLDRRPIDAPTQLALGLALSRVRPELAREALDVAVALDPAMPAQRLARVWMLSETGERESVLREIEESTYRAPSLQRHPLLSEEAATRMDPVHHAAAARGLERAVPRAGLPAAVALAGLHARARQHRDAALAWERAVALAPSGSHQVVFLRRAGWERSQDGDLEGAEAALRRAIEIRPEDPKARAALLSYVLAPRGDLPSAVEEAREAVDARADSLEVDVALAEVARQAGDEELELSILSRVADRYPGDVRAHLRFGFALHRQGRFAEAVDRFVRATRLAPGNAVGWYHLGLAAERAYEFQLAEQAFARAVEEAPGNSDYRRNRDRFRRRVERG